MEKDERSEDLGVCTELEALDRLLDVDGLELCDVGCGDGWLARELAARGARVRAFEPEPEQARRNAAAPAHAGVSFAEAGAERLPLGDGAVDGVLFHYSLHHVPRELLHVALAEARRVLRPDGILFVAEPVPEDSFAEVLAPFHDETFVQQSAERALAAHARPRFASERIARFVTETRYADFAAFVADIMAPTYVRYTREQVDCAAVRERFARCAEADGGFVLRQPVRVNLYRQPLVRR